MNDQPQPKHDGELDGRNLYNVKLILRHIPHYASVRIGHGQVSYDEVWMSPAQSLSLLAWLEQERSTLEQLAKEQEAK